MSERIFLGRSGKIFGPFTEKELQALQATGEIREYVWIWSARTKAWKTLESPPPSPEGEAANPSVGAVGGWRDYEVLCHDRRSIVTGVLISATETGCELLCKSEGSVESAIPPFGVHTSLVLNLMNHGTEQSLNVGARLLAAQRGPEGWVYRLSWDQFPSFSADPVQASGNSHD